MSEAGHPEARVMCGPKDLCTPSEVAQVLRFAQDDRASLRMTEVLLMTELLSGCHGR